MHCILTSDTGFIDRMVGFSVTRMDRARRLQQVILVENFYLNYLGSFNHSTNAYLLHPC